LTNSSPIKTMAEQPPKTTEIKEMKGVQAAKRQILFLLSLRLKGGEFKGFTLLELLVAMLIGSIITLIMLTGVINLMGTNQKEGARSDTQRDAQAAIDYMSRDLREAIYVYDGKCLSDTTANNGRVELIPAVGVQAATYCSALLNFLPTSLKAATQLPVLAFWRVDPLPEALKKFCRDNATVWVDPKTAEAAASPTGDPKTKALAALPCSSQTTYTLVVYSLDWSNPNGIWRGRARLKRYQLPQYEYAATVSEAPPNTTGWVSPLEKEIGFPQWPLKTSKTSANTTTIISAQTAGLPTGADNAVLIDFMDDVKFSGTDTANCPSGGADDPIFGISPPATLATGDRARRSIYTCIRGGASAGLNQEVIVRLQANAAGRPGVPRIGSSLPITMETRVLTRGVLNKGSK
jgi:prepilin-type N-terminal cleavage/methylation domain-containing protein